MYGRACGVGQHKWLWLGLKLDGVVVNRDGGEGDSVGLSGQAPGGGGLYKVYYSKESLCWWGEVGRHCSCVMGLFVFVCGEEFMKCVNRCGS
jgi:hypothetical protein